MLGKTKKKIANLTYSVAQMSLTIQSLKYDLASEKDRARRLEKEIEEMKEKHDGLVDLSSELTRTTKDLIFGILDHLGLEVDYQEAKTIIVPKKKEEEDNGKCCK